MIAHVYAVEISGACNLESVCTWCPMHNRPRMRKRGLMSHATLVRALDWVTKAPPRKGEALALHNFGEPLLHPEFDVFAKLFSQIAPITMSTNGVLLTDQWADRLAAIKWEWISVSPWNETAQLKAAQKLSQRGISVKFPPGATHNWASQAKTGPDKRLFNHCPYLNHNQGVIRWDGSVTTCCITDREEDVIGHIDNEEPQDVEVRGYSLCETCHHMRGE